MRKLVYSLLIYSTLPLLALAQNPHTMRLKQALARATTDTNRILLMAEVSASYRYSRPDSALKYAQQGAKLGERIHYAKGAGRCLNQLGFILSERGDLGGALRQLLHAQGLNSLAKDTAGLAQTLQNIGYSYISFPDYKQAKTYLFQAKTVGANQQRTDSDAALTVANLGYAYRYQNQLDSARFYQQMAYRLATQLPKNQQSAWGDPLPFILRELGNIAAKSGQINQAIQYLRQSKAAATADNNQQVYARTCNTLATLFQQQQQPDSAIYYAHQALTTSRKTGLTIGVLKNSQLLAKYFKSRRQTDSALKYTELMLGANDSLYNQQRIKQLEEVNFAEQRNRRRIEERQVRFESQVRQFALLSGAIVLLVIALILWRNNRRQREANTRLTNTLTDLRTTQTQLVQAEKMASLGELTAGIAHEIQNPLNFVNNFSEVSTELVTELEEEQQKPDRDTQLETELLGDLKQNLQKITQHGQRASSIVKGMLEHSRTTTGQREPTDLNALADEYLKLAYHGLRAKNKDFNVELKTDFDSNLPRISVVSQDIGRVLLNLYNNGFYAVQQRAKKNEPGYQPTVWVSTECVDDNVQIRVRDNGMGIPDAVKAKIFQPFFTTKPTGEGTGLGLSLSYDIVTKGHGGTIEVESTEGKGTEFVVTLPA